nr:angiotensin I [Lophius litulon]
NRVYVHPFHL